MLLNMQFTFESYFDFAIQEGKNTGVYGEAFLSIINRQFQSMSLVIILIYFPGKKCVSLKSLLVVGVK